MCRCSCTRKADGPLHACLNVKSLLLQIRSLHEAHDSSSIELSQCWLRQTAATVSRRSMANTLVTATRLASRSTALLAPSRALAVTARAHWQRGHVEGERCHRSHTTDCRPSRSHGTHAGAAQCRPSPVASASVDAAAGKRRGQRKDRTLLELKDFLTDTDGASR